MMKFNLPLTYQPKVQPVIDGFCCQTIRLINPGLVFPTLHKKKVGDLIRFYIWEGKPYHSKRKTITEYSPLTTVQDIRISSTGIDNLKFQGEYGLWEWKDLDLLADLDGIIPGTGEELFKVLSNKNKITEEWKDAQLLRWK
jgi:hypothetical protein